MGLYIFKSKPIRAIQWTGHNFMEIWNWLSESYEVEHINLDILVVTMITDKFRQEHVHLGQYLILNEKGEVRRLTQRYFERHYEPTR